MSNFKSVEGDIKDLFITDYWLIDRYVGNKLWAWGFNAYEGNLGDNTMTNRSSPVQTICGGTNWKQVASSSLTTYAIKTDGTLWAWGNNNQFGQLGDNTNGNDKSSPVQTVAGGTNWKQVSSGNNHVAAIKTDGTLWTWGKNDLGQLGDNTVAHKSSPVQTVAGGTNWKQVSAGSNHVAAIKNDGTLWGWGTGYFGALGDNTNGTSGYKSSPVQTVAGGTSWQQASAGDNNTAAIKTDGTLWCWGYNASGQLGDNTIVDKSSPVQTVAGGTNWKQISLGVSISAAIKTDGTLWCWGYNGYGQLGDNTRTSKSSPVQTVAGGTNWKQINCGGYNAVVAIKTDGTLWCWGYNTKGALGDNTVTHKSSPVQTVAGGTTWKQATTGYKCTFAITYGDG